MPENQCVNQRVALVFVVAYGTQMNVQWGNLTRWEQLQASLNALPMSTQLRLQHDAISAFIRVGHDPSPDPGTPVMGDDSGIIDGQAYDVTWSDCNWMEILDAYDAAGEPMNGNLFGMGSWLKGAMDLAQSEIVAAKMQQQNAGRAYRVIVITHGFWSAQAGSPIGSPPADDPALTMTSLHQTHGVPTYVVAVDPDEPMKVIVSNGLAAAGGTGSAHLAELPNDLTGALDDAISLALGNASCD